MNPVIQLAEIHKTYHTGEVDVHAVRGVTLAIQPGEFVALMGAATSQISYTASKGAVLSMSRELGVEFEGDHAVILDVQFDLGVGHGHLSSVADWMTTGVWGTSEGKGPPGPVGVSLMRLITSMPLTTLPKAT